MNNDATNPTQNPSHQASASTTIKAANKVILKFSLMPAVFYHLALELQLCYKIGRVSTKEKNMTIIERSEFKGKPVLVLKRNEEDPYPFSFGMSKARLIVENIEEIKKFVAENEGK